MVNQVKLAIFGSRTFVDFVLLEKEALKRHLNISMIVSGGAVGADTQARGKRAGYCDSATIVRA